ncbi:hypothetical protein N8987_05485 [Crocinitomix sp.]|nr:hypothetical protein [Crocinitomix sp.]
MKLFLNIKLIGLFLVLSIGLMGNAAVVDSLTTVAYDPKIVSEYLNGTASEAMPMMKLMMQVVAILFVGIFLWRISAVFNRKKVSRRQDMFSDSRFQKHWRNK